MASPNSIHRIPTLPRDIHFHQHCDKKEEHARAPIIVHLPSIGLFSYYRPQTVECSRCQEVLLTLWRRVLSHGTLSRLKRQQLRRFDTWYQAGKYIDPTTPTGFSRNPKPTLKSLTKMVCSSSRFFRVIVLNCTTLARI